jgi:hypothetical protein
MALIDISNQYRYTGRGAFDAKALVKTYAELISTATWTTKNVSGAEVITAYNGMLTAVWLNKDDVTKNGIYFLHDPEANTPLKTPDVTKEAHWHKLCQVEDIAGFAEQIESLRADLNKMQAEVDELQDAATIVADSRAAFPKVGTAGKLYVATFEAKTYVWHNNDYLPVGDGTGSNEGELEIQIIMGGGPTA